MKLNMFFRNTINALLAAGFAFASGVTTIMAVVEPYIGFAAAVMGLLAGAVTVKAQLAKQKIAEFKYKKLMEEEDGS